MLVRKLEATGQNHLKGNFGVNLLIEIQMHLFSPMRIIEHPPKGKCFWSGKASWSRLLILYKKPGLIMDISSMTINLVYSKLFCKRINGSPSKSSIALLACLVTGIWRRAWTVFPSMENAAVPVGAAVERMSRWAPYFSFMYLWQQLSV